MNQLSNRKWRNGLTLMAVAAVVAGCGDNDNSSSPPLPPPPAPISFQYEVSVVNLTTAQPFSPLAVIAHNEPYQLFAVGEAASVELENLAEGGSNTDLLNAADNIDAVLATASGDSPIAPGASGLVSITVNGADAAALRVSVVTMLVNTNDAITAARNIDVSALAVDQSLVVNTISYDSGTEANSEAVGTIPGPADGGEGFNAARSDIADQVTAHSGVISADDGLADSVLSQQHRWDNPVARVRITRVQ